MFWLGLILPVCYVASYTGAAIPTQYPVLSIALVAGVWMRGNIAAMVPLLLAIGWAALSMTWAQNITASVYGFWIMCLWALSFWLGTALFSLFDLWRGLAVGMSISSAVAVAQWFGWHGVPHEGMAGLLYNSTLQGMCLAIVILGLWTNGMLLYIPALLPGLMLAHSRGAFLVLAVGVLARFGRYQVMIAMLALMACYIGLFPGPSDLDRMRNWAVASVGLNWHGMGIGAFDTVFYYDVDKIKWHPSYVHNDYLQLWFELGIGSLGIYFVLGWAAWRGSGCRPVIVALLAASAFYFPIYAPIPGFIFFLLAGHALRDFHWRGFVRDVGGLAAVLRGGPSQQGGGGARGAGFPVQSSISEV